MSVQRYWIVMDNEGGAWPATLTYTRSDSIKNVIALLKTGRAGTWQAPMTWEKLRRRGFRCVRVTLCEQGKPRHMGWPLGILPDFDKIAAAQGLPHWSCLLPDSNQLWVRRDGACLSINAVEGWPSQLRQYDRNLPIGKTLKSFLGKTT